MTKVGGGDKAGPVGAPDSGSRVADAESALAGMPADWAVGQQQQPGANKTTGRMQAGGASKTETPKNTSSSSSSTAAGLRQTGDPSEPEFPDSESPTREGMDSFHESTTLITGNGMASTDDVLACIMEYMKYCAKEVKENTEIQGMFRQATLSAKNANLTEQNKVTDATLDEAREKADIAMTAAWTGMAIGIGQGLLQVAAAGMNYKASSMNADAGNETAGKGFKLGADMINAAGAMLQGMNSFVQGKSQHDQLMVDANAKSAVHKKEANRMQQVVNESEKKEQSVDDSVKLSRDHLQAMKDVLKKCMDLKSQGHDAVNSYGR